MSARKRIELLIEPWAVWEERLGAYGYKCAVLTTLAHSPIHFGCKAPKYSTSTNRLKVMEGEVNRVISGTVACLAGCNVTVLITGGITPT